MKRITKEMLLKYLDEADELARDLEDTLHGSNGDKITSLRAYLRIVVQQIELIDEKN